MVALFKKAKIHEWQRADEKALNFNTLCAAKRHARAASAKWPRTKQDTAARSRACWSATSSKMEYTENTVICNCKHVTLADIDDALQRSARFSDVEKEFAEVQKLTSCSTGCGGCHDKIMAVLSERLSG